MTFTIDRRKLLLGAAAAVAFTAGPAFADDPILTIDGKIAGAGPRTFTLADLMAQPVASFATKTPWHATAVTFEGIGFDVLLALVGPTGTRLRFSALNDYVVEADIADLTGLGGVFAYRENGRQMPVSDKGPLFLVFPFDSDERLQHQSLYARCIWQLATIDVV